MTLYRFLLRSLRRSSAAPPSGTLNHHPNLHPQNPIFSLPLRSFAFSSAEEAAAERRRRKRRLRIEPPLAALRQPPPRYSQANPDAPRLPDSTSALVGPRLNLHNRVQSLIRAGDLDSAAAIARHSVFSNTRPTVFTCNAIIAAMYRAKRYYDAKVLFQYFFNQFNIIPNVVSYNNLIVSHCESGEVDDALKVYRHILENAPFSPSSVTYRHLTKGLIDSDRISEAMDLLREMLNKGHGADSLVFNNLILGFLNLGNLEKANELFDELKERCTVYDGVVNATFMEWYFNQGKEKEAMESYKSLLDRKFRMVPVTRNVLLEVLLKYGRKAEAWALFEDMLDDHTPPTFQAVNSDTFNLMVNEYFKEGKVLEAMEVFKMAGKGPKSKPFAMDVAGYNNMITRLCEVEMMEEAEKYYTEICSKSLSPDVTTYRTMIEAYVKADRVGNALEKYTKMVEAGLRVIPLYANKWFSYLIEKGKVVECAPILTKMGEREPKPDLTTYDIVIRGLCREGNLDTCFNLLSEMMSYGVGITGAFKDYVLEVFDKQGRRQDIDRLLMRFPFNSSSMRPNGPPRRPASGPSIFPRQMANQPQMQGQSAGTNQMAWQSKGFPQTSVAGQVSGPSQMTGQVARDSQMHGQPWPSQAAGMVSGPSSLPGQVAPHHQMHEQAAGAAQIPWQASRSQMSMSGQVTGPSQFSGQAATYSHTWGQASQVAQATWPSSSSHFPGGGQAAGQPQMYGQAASQSQVPEQAMWATQTSWHGSNYSQMQGNEVRSHMLGHAAPPHSPAGQVAEPSEIPMAAESAA